MYIMLSLLVGGGGGDVHLIKGACSRLLLLSLITRKQVKLCWDVGTSVLMRVNCMCA